MVSMVLSMLLYSTEYSIKDDVEDIETNISEFLDRDVKVVKYEKVDNILFVYFTNETKDTVGYTVLYRGLNFRYQIRQANYGARNQVLYINEFKTLFNRYWAIFGTNYENRISTITFNAGESNVTINKIGNMDDILVIQESNNKYPEMTYVYEYTLLDEKGNDITKDMRSYLTGSGSGGFGRGKAELFLLNVYCVVIILVGYWISRMIKTKTSVDSFTK